MSNIQLLLIIASIVIGVLVILLVGMPYLKKKGKNVEEVLKDLNDKGIIAKAVADQVKPLLPKSAQNVIDLIEKWAPIAVGNAEQLAHTGDIDKSDRAIVAENVVLNILKESGIEPTNNQKELIDAAIKNAVNDLGHDNTSNIKSVGIAYASSLTAEVKGVTPIEKPLSELNPEEIKPVEEVKTEVSNVPVNDTNETTSPVENQAVAKNATQTETISSEEALKQIHEIVSKIAPTV